MKIKYLLMAVAALAAVACSDKDENPQSNPEAGSATEKSYLAINLKSADDVTRAEEFVAGTEDEQAISKVTFYFFDEAGNEFNVSSNGNYIFVDNIENNDEVGTANIESMTDPVVVIEEYNGQLPAKVVAVVNYEGTTSLSLADLKEYLTTVGHTNKKDFIMTNAVYFNEASNEVVDATPLTIENFQTDRSEALKNPVTIYVERVTAKVNIAAETGNFGVAAFDTGVKVEESPIYARIDGWGLVATQAESYFVKSIDKTWTEDYLGFAWNNPAYHRSYWTDLCVDEAVSNEFAYNDLTNNSSSVEYIGEHVADNAAEHTKYIVAATLCIEGGTNYEPVEVAQWYGTTYMGGEDVLLAAVAPTLKNKLLQKDGSVYTAIDDSQLQCVVGLGDAASYEVSFQLAEGVSTDNWYSFDGSSYVAVANPNEVLAAIEPAKVWNSGFAYYFADIKHLGDEGKAGEFGIVRNHSYQITIKGVKGLGTPVYDPDYYVEPVKPIDKDTYISAEINVLSWRVVSENVTLE